MTAWPRHGVCPSSDSPQGSPRGDRGRTMSVGASHPVEGHVRRGFEAVREALADNFARRRELGGPCCACHRGEKVVDLWGGIPKQADGRAVGAEHHGDRLVGHQGPSRGDPRHRPLSGLARLRRTGVRVLAGVRAAAKSESLTPRNTARAVCRRSSRSIDLRILSSIVRPCSESYSLASVCVEAHALLC